MGNRKAAVHAGNLFSERISGSSVEPTQSLSDMWRVFGDLLRTRGPAGAFVVLIPSLVWLAIMLLPFWLPGGTWIADQAGLILGAGLVLGAAVVRAWVVETRRWRQEQSRNPIHRWPPLPAHDRSFIRTRLQRR
jgi:hypothetical protein